MKHKSFFRPKGKVLAFTDDEIKSAFNYQQKHGVWNFYDERQFSENLLAERFNYLILVYSLIISAFAVMHSSKVALGVQFAVLFVGVVIIALIGITIYRLYAKVIINIDIINKLGDEHPFCFIRKETEQRKVWFSYANKLIGIVIPVFCLSTILIAMGYILCQLCIE